MPNDIQRQISSAMMLVDKHYAGLVADSMTDVESYPTSFLKHYQIYKIENSNPSKPIVFYVGFAPNKPIYLLTDSSENYAKLIQADGSVVDKSNTAIDYVTAYLEVTRSMSRLFYIVRSSQDINFRPNLNDKEEKLKAAFLEKYQSIVAPPTAEQTNGYYVVTLYSIEEQSLKCYSITVNQQGNLKIEITTLKDGLPLVYGL